MKRRYRSLGERLMLYEEVLRLRQKDLGYKRISKTLGEIYGVRLNSGLICNWISGRHDPLGRCIIKSFKALNLRMLWADGLVTAR